MELLKYINDLISSGRYVFAKHDVRKVLKISDKALNQVLWRYKKQKKIAEPAQGFYVIIPVEYHNYGCLPPEQFIHELMTYLHIPNYYVCLLSAAQLYGAAHQKPQILQIMIPIKRRAMHCGDFQISFITKVNVADTPIRQFKTSRGYFNVSTPGATILDLIRYTHRCAGWNNVFTILIELSEFVDAEKLGQLIKSTKNSIILQRLGYLFDLSKAHNLSKIIYQELEHRVIKPHALIPGLPIDKTQLNKKCQLYINEQLEADL